MGVRIEQINVETIGPVSELQLKLGSFNLIYGRNEQGKTFLVEFLIRSLFNNYADWQLRPIDCRGKVMVSGLTEKPLALMPASRHKLDDMLVEAEGGMPAQIGRLLVVKGAELSFEQAYRPGISQQVLKTFLAGHSVLDDIQGKISKTVRAASISEGQIIGNKQGEIRNRNYAKERLDRIDDLFEQLENTYSGAERQSLKARLQELDKTIAVQEQARRHRAYQLQQKIQEGKAELGRLPQAALDRLSTDFSQLQEGQKRIQRQEAKLDELARQSAHFDWLVAAINLYEQRQVPGMAGVSPLYPLVIAVVLFLAVVLSFVGFPLGTLVLILIAAVVGWFYIRQYRTAAENAADREELNRLAAEYQSRFNRPFSGLPQMKAEKQAMEEAYHGAKSLQKEVAEEKEALARRRDQIAAQWQGLTGRVPPENTWAEALRTFHEQRNQLQQQINLDEIALAALGVAVEEYVEEPAGEPYRSETLLALREEWQRVQGELDRKTAALNHLKQRISEITQDAITVDWETLIQHLQLKREVAAGEYRELTAKILAGILVNEQLEVIRRQEAQKIREKLSSPVVCRPVFEITGRYSGVRYYEERVWVTDDYGQFALSDLSTGALEQVLLGLRLGFAAHLLRRNQLFLLLDDAFQHADWQRRERLMDQMITLAKAGWQIIYFSMDDHIKSLFDRAGQIYFRDDYRYYEIGQ